MGNHEVKTPHNLALSALQLILVKMEFTNSTKLDSIFVPFREAAHQGYSEKEDTGGIRFRASQDVGALQPLALVPRGNGCYGTGTTDFEVQ